MSARAMSGTRDEEKLTKFIEGLRAEYGWYSAGGNDFDSAAYIERLEREVRERLRVNVGLIIENNELRGGR